MVARYWHTLRYLRPVQLYGRLWFRLYRPRADTRSAPGLRAPARGWEASTRRPVSMLGPGRFRFLNQTHDALGTAAWNDPTRDKLWLYNLHYFDDLNAVDAAARTDWHRALLRRWIAENPPGVGNGWEPYPISLRLVNWIKWLLAGHALPGEFLESLAVQTRWLRRRLEHHLLGNHLFANAKALVFAGAFFVGPEAKRWGTLGTRLLRRELREQILPDGGHFERSPMYHAILLEDVLDVIQLARIFPGALNADLIALCRADAERMLDWLSAMTHPDDEIAFFNDAAFGIAPRFSELQSYARTLGISDARTRVLPTWLRDSGYVRLEAGPAVAILDAAPIGPDYLPGHAHADTLSFELSVLGQRVIVNGGTSCYGAGAQRLAERGTAAHSTVRIDGVDSSEVWSGFRVARRARPFGVVVEQAPARSCAELSRALPAEAWQVSAAHDGYRRLQGRPVHRRTWGLTQERLCVMDSIEGAANEAIVYLHLHPAIQVQIESARGARNAKTIGRLRLRGGQWMTWEVEGGDVTIIPDQWHPQFGLSEPSRCIAVEMDDVSCRFDLAWTNGP